MSVRFMCGVGGVFMMLALVVGGGGARQSLAQTPIQVPDQTTAQSSTQTPMEAGTPLTITADGPALIRLDRDASSVIVGNPAHATAMMDNPRLIILSPVAPGMTSLVVLDESGDPIIERKILVNPPRAGYVRINRVCEASQAEGCVPASVYYCPDGCYSVSIAGSEPVTGGQFSDDQGAGEAVMGGADDEAEFTPPAANEFAE